MIVLSRDKEAKLQSNVSSEYWYSENLVVAGDERTKRRLNCASERSAITEPPD